MEKKTRRVSVLVLVILALASLACGGLVQGVAENAAGQLEETAAAFATEAGVELENLQPTLDAAMTEAGVELENLQPTLDAAMTEAAEAAAGAESGVNVQNSANGQWAVAASASSQYGSDGWSANQMIGAPDVYPECGDITEAWASNSSSEVATVNLTYAQAVIPSQINIYQTYNPGAISQVTVISANGESVVVYTATPAESACPQILTVDVTGVTFPVNQVEIVVDQTNHPSWNEIDAVEMVGTAQ